MINDIKSFLQINKNNQIKHFSIHFYVPTLGIESSNTVAVECDRLKSNCFSESKLFSVKYSSSCSYRKRSMILLIIRKTAIGL